MRKTLSALNSSIHPQPPPPHNAAANEATITAAANLKVGGRSSIEKKSDEVISPTYDNKLHDGNKKTNNNDNINNKREIAEIAASPPAIVANRVSLISNDLPPDNNSLRIRIASKLKGEEDI